MTTPQLNPAVQPAAKKARKVRRKSGGASRIPCPFPVVNPLSCPAQPHSYLAGLDFLKVSLWLDWDSPDFLIILKDFKDEFQDEELSTPYASERTLVLDAGLQLNMQRTGAGKYTYVLKSADVTLLFSNHKSSAPFPNCRVEIGSMSCWNPGWKYLFDRILRWLAAYGGTPRKQQISEFHITADLLGCDFTATGMIDIHRWKAKAGQQKLCYEDYVPSYAAFGKGDFMLRVYDKTAELKGDAAKRDFFNDLWSRHLGRPAPEHVTRIEFQIRRPVSKELNIHTVGQLAENLNAVWQYCVSEWCEFCAEPISAEDRRNKNHQRYAAAPLWEQVRSVQFAAGRTLQLSRKKTPPHRNVDVLLKQAAGCFLSICGIQGLAPDDLDGHASHSVNLLWQQLQANYRKNRTEYMRKIETKYNRAHVTI